MILFVNKKILLAGFVPFVPSELFTLGHLKSSVYKVVPTAPIAPFFLGNGLHLNLLKITFGYSTHNTLEF